MHMADALISPPVGGALWAASAGLLAYCSRKVREGFDASLVPLMGVLGAFVFAAQMINFTIPGTGSSGHLGGALLLAVLLGPYAAFLTIASVLVVQALFFADGGLLALGCNIFNLGFFPCFIAYPFIYKPMAGDAPSGARLSAACITASVAGMLMGATGVVLETVASGITALPFSNFLLLMLPVHLAIGLVEGFATAGVATFVHTARPEVLQLGAHTSSPWSMKKLVAAFAVLALLTGGVFSWFASQHPDGLEWSIASITGEEELPTPERGVYATLAQVQEGTALMPDYAPKGAEAEEHATAEKAWPAVDAGTSLAGVVGGVLTLLLAGAVGLLLRRRTGAPSKQ